MGITPKDLVAFWRVFTAGLKGGNSVQASLEEAAAVVASSSSAPAIDKLVKEFAQSHSLYEAMSLQEHAFSRCVLAMVRAAEAGGVLDVVAGHIAQAIDDGNLPASAIAPPKHDDPVKFWRAAGWLLSCGVPMLKTMELLGQEVAGPGLRKACREIRQGLTAHTPLANILAKMPDAFTPEIVRAVRAAQDDSTLDEAAFAIADALAAGDTSALSRQTSKPQPATAGSTTKGDHAMKPADDPQAAEFVKAMLLESFAAQASDIHMDPTESGGIIRFRIDGVLQKRKTPLPCPFDTLVAQLKKMSGLDPAQQRLPQVGQMIIDDHENYVILTSTLRTFYGERVVLRLLSRDVVQVCLHLPRVVPRHDDLETVRRLCRLPHGLVLVTGPMGSGKTTLAYAMLQTMDTAGSCILSVEDPVEYVLPGIAQVQVNPAEGLTYAKALRTVYRQDLDVVYVGDVLDLETLNLLAKLVMTGHLALSQLHTNTPAQTIARLLELGMEPFLVNATLKAVISQHLLRLLCPHCRQAIVPTLHSLPPAMVEYINAHKDATFYDPKGCEKCHNTGYSGRMAVQEILLPDDRLRQLLLKSPGLTEIQQAARQTGMVDMVTKATDAAAEGKTSLDEVANLALQVM